MSDGKNTSDWGHAPTLETLLDLQRRGRLPHALLLMGPEGIGKKKVALEMARSLLCHAGTRCGSCPSCELGNFLEHPDLSLIEPEEGRIKIDTIREIRRGLSLPPLYNHGRVVVVVDAHAMNAAAANALLKTLEEPPAHTFFLLVSHAPGWIPRTIVSRCQKVRFSPLSEVAVQEIVQTSGKLAEKGLSSLPPALLRAAGGSAKRALDLLEMAELTPPFKSLFPGKEAFNFSQAHELAQQISEADQVLPFLDYLQTAAQQHLSEGEKNSTLEFEILVFADRISEIRRSLRLNANPRMHLARLLMFFQEPLATRL